MPKSNLFKISSNSKIFVPVTPSVSTGGPEAIFRLLHYLINYRGLNCFVYFYPSSDQLDPVHDEYKKFNVPIATAIDDIEDKARIKAHAIDTTFKQWRVYILRTLGKKRTIIGKLGKNRLSK